MACPHPGGCCRALDMGMLWAYETEAHGAVARRLVELLPGADMIRSTATRAEIFSGAKIEGEMMRTHTLKATTKSVHFGGFSPHLEPALAVHSGDCIEVETYTAFCLKEQFPRELITPDLQEIALHLPGERRLGPGNHLLTGPIRVHGARPGHVLEVRLQEIAPLQPVGFNTIRPGWGALPGRFSETSLYTIPLDLGKGLAEFPPGSGLRIPLRPFFGVLGVATSEANTSSIPPGNYGGNMDNRHLQAGSRVFLPVFVPGALFSIGDGHAVQGDGEVDVTAIETSMKGRITLVLRKDLHLTTPMADTPEHIIFMGFAGTLDGALEQALLQGIGFLEDFAGMTAQEAYALCSVCVHFHVTQVVNIPQKGVHGLLPKSIFPEGISL